MLDETLITLTEATKLLPGRPHAATVWRFYARGVKGVKLETIVSGGRRFTSREAIARFIARTTAASNGAPLPQRTSCERVASIKRAEAELAAAGI